MISFFRKPSVIILVSFILGYIGLFLPGTKVYYQFIDGQEVSSHIGYDNIMGDRYRGFIPCNLARLKLSLSDTFFNLYLVWQIIGRALSFTAISFGVQYVINKKIKLWKFFSLAAVLMIGPIVILSIYSKYLPPTEMCSENIFYQVISFTPYFPTLLIWVTAILFGYFGIQMSEKETQLET